LRDYEYTETKKSIDQGKERHMSKNNTTWGVNENNQDKKAEKGDSAWGTNSYNYHAGFAALLKAQVFICAFVVPLIACLILASLVDDSKYSGLLMIMYPLVAFAIWVTMSYRVKIFDNISKIAYNSEIIIHKLEKDSERL